jgi:nitroreductase
MLVIENKKNKIIPSYSDSCINCYHCISACPTESITPLEHPHKEFKQIDKEKVLSPEVIDEIILSRRSVREFTDKPVNKSILEKLISVVSHAPTGHNIQGVEFSIITDKLILDQIENRISGMINTLGSTVSYFMPFNFTKFFMNYSPLDMLQGDIDTMHRSNKPEFKHRQIALKGAPVLIAAHTGLKSVTAKDDCIIALDQLNLAAHARGLGSTWLAIVVGAVSMDPSLKTLMNIPALNMVHGVMILGWPKYEYIRTVPRKTIKVNWIS